MNITDFRQMPLSQVYDAVSHKAHRHGVAIARGELIGLVPAAAAERQDEWLRHFHEFDPEEKILERKLNHPLAWPVLSGPASRLK
jgi:glutamate formiminotransferase / 5-formyltetrahydrofolate cyclo-ligase